MAALPETGAERRVAVEIGGCMDHSVTRQRTRFLMALGVGLALHRLLERAHLFVSASAYEGFGLSTIEAMSAATVPVVTAVGAHPDVIQHGLSGFLTDPDATELSKYIEQVLAMSPERVAAMGDEARASTRRFSWSEIAPHYEDLYSQVLRTGHNAGAWSR